MVLLLCGNTLLGLRFAFKRVLGGKVEKVLGRKSLYPQDVDLRFVPNFRPLRSHSIMRIVSSKEKPYPGVNESRPHSF